MSGAANGKIVTKDQNVIETQGTRDLFGILLYISTVENLDLAKVFQFPLTPVPLFLTHIDGTPNKTDKAKLLHHLEKLVETEAPTHTDIVLIDAMFFLHTLIDPPLLF